MIFDVNDDDDDLQDLECCFADDKHYIKNGITLKSCGHSLCQMCLPINSNLNVKCGLCGIETHKNFIDNFDTERLKNKFNVNLNKLFTSLENRMKKQLDKINNHIENSIESITLKVNYLEEEIQIKIESIKIELDLLLDKFKNELFMIKNDIIKSENEKLVKFNTEIKQFENTWKELKYNNENHLFFKNEEIFFKYQNELHKLNEFYEIMDRKNYQFDFNVSNKIINESIIGNIVYKIYEKEIKIINEKLANGKYQSFNLDARPLDMIILPNNSLLSAHYLDKKLNVYDENFNFVKSVYKIDCEKKFEPYSLTHSIKHGIYISDHAKNQIILTNYDFVKLKSYGCKGSNNNQFDTPCGLFYKNNFLYICDYNNKRIQVLTSDLEFSKSIYLDYNPWLITASDFTICVSRGDCPGGLYFYNDKFKLRYKYQFGECRISLVDSCFFGFSFKSKKMYSFDTYGLLIEDVSMTRFRCCTTNIADGSIVRFNKNLVISFYYQCYFVVFKTE